MRETLHQLSLALALPITVLTVWAVRGNPAGPHTAQTAAAWRAELAELPLPVAQRLRAPRVPVDAQVAPRMDDETLPHRHRALLSPAQLPQPVALPLETRDEDRSGVAGASPSARPDATQVARAVAPEPTVPLAPELPLFAGRSDAKDSAARAETTASAALPANGEKQAVAAAPSRSAATAAPAAAEPTGAAKSPPAVAATAAAKSPAVIASTPASRTPTTIATPRGAAAEPSETKPFSISLAHPTVAKLDSQRGKSPQTSPAQDHAPNPPAKSSETSQAAREREHGLLAAALPTIAPPLQPIADFATSDPKANAPGHAADVTPLVLLDFPLTEPGALAALPDASHGAASLPGSSQAGRFSPVFAMLAIPEPASAMLLAAALAAIAAARRRRQPG